MTVKMSCGFCFYFSVLNIFSFRVSAVNVTVKPCGIIYPERDIQHFVVFEIPFLSVHQLFYKTNWICSVNTGVDWEENPHSILEITEYLNPSIIKQTTGWDQS